ncbi:hypothetical protein VNO78_02540 [Psophocarpus tetragonolobus]|uniref:RING-type E3 ubiquitin transferase n=1 Tax=Psophocarpus tetragonolobus TaxID=3891 RepID=A0AAN9TC20_PSOTE
MEIVISLTILFVGIAILVVIHFCMVGRAFGRNNSNGNEEATQGQSMKRMFCRDNMGNLNNLPCYAYKDPEKGCNSLVDCAICLENFKDGDVCRLLPNCGHSYHANCIELWMFHSPKCPVCRTWVHSPVVLKEQQSTVSESVEIVTA